MAMLRPKKSLGQNFLMHPRIAERIADTAQLPPNATVLEIGPGRGILTRALLARARKVIAIEADAELVHELTQTFAKEIAEKQLELIHSDIRTWILDNLSAKGGSASGGNRSSVKDGYHVVANIPYYLTGELFRMLLEADNQPTSLTLLVQKEVAERIARSKKESVLSLSIKAYGEPEYEFTVKRGAFIPAPNVDSAVLSIREISRRNFATRAQEKRFFDLVHAGFAHKRKFVQSNLKDRIVSDLIPPKARAEDLPLSTWLALASE